MENKEIQLANIQVALQGLCESNEISGCRQKEICDYFQDNLAENQTVSLLGSGAYKVVFEVKCYGQPDQVYAFFKKSKTEQEEIFPGLKNSAEILQGLKRSLSDKSSLKLSEITKLTLVFPDEINIDSQMTIGSKVVGGVFPYLESTVANKQGSEEGRRVHEFADSIYAWVVKELYAQCGCVCLDLDSDNIRYVLDEQNRVIQIFIFDFDCFAAVRRLAPTPEAERAMQRMHDKSFRELMEKGRVLTAGTRKVVRWVPKPDDPGYQVSVKENELITVMVGGYPGYLKALDQVMEPMLQKCGVFNPGKCMIPKATNQCSSPKSTESAFK